MSRLKARIAVVTGAASGIGKGIAVAFAREGANIVVADKVEERQAAEVLAGISSHGRQALFVQTDVSDEQSVRLMAEAALARFGRVDILVNNAGIFNMGPLSEVTEQDFDRQFGVNVRGLVFVTQAVAARMVAQGRGGKIINLSSQAGRRGEAYVSVYCASKAAVISITQSLGLELIKHRINVNGIAPGVVDTPMWDHVDSLFAKYEHRPLGEKKRLVGEAVPYGRMGLPSDFGGAAVFLASSDADYVVAQTLNVDGGNWMS